jgi:hypothetical protein
LDPSSRQNPSAAKGLGQAVVSLNREILAVLCGDEAANIGRTVAQIVRGDGWAEARASAVLVDAIATWLGRDAVQISGFYANGTGPVEVVAKVGRFYISGHGIEGEDDALINGCERHRARYSQSRVDAYDLSASNTRFNWGTPVSKRAADRLAGLLTEEVDPEIARMILGAL